MRDEPPRTPSRAALGCLIGGLVAIIASMLVSAIWGIGWITRSSLGF